MRGSTLLQIDRIYLQLCHLVRKRQSHSPPSGLHYPWLAWVWYKCDPFSHHRFNFKPILPWAFELSIDFLKTPNCKHFCHVFPHVISHVFPVVCTPCASGATAVIFYRFLNTLPASLRPPLLVPDGHGHRFARWFWGRYVRPSFGPYWQRHRQSKD